MLWLGAILTVLCEVGKLLIGLYIGKQGLESTYGAAALIVVVLFWVYYSAQLVLMGVESPISMPDAMARDAMRPRRIAKEAKANLRRSNGAHRFGHDRDGHWRLHKLTTAIVVRLDGMRPLARQKG
jgi:uncharacterized BrkB/YihY/UPF0761 family membrane protein